MTEQTPAPDGGAARPDRRIVVAWLCLVATLIAGATFVVQTNLLRPDDASSHVVVPDDLTGANAVAAGERLRAVGFSNVVFVPDGGGTVVVRSRWTVRSVDGAGTAVDASTQVIVRVARGVPTA